MSDVIDNEAERRFEVTKDGHTAVLTYSLEGGTITLIHTEVPDELGGHGLGGVLVEAALARAARDDLTIIPVCPYARHWMRKHPEALEALRVDWVQEPLS